MKRLALVVLVACGGASRGGGVADVAIAPVVGSAAPQPVAPREQDVSRFDLALAQGRACVRVESRVKCAADVGALVDAPVLAEDAIDLALGEGFGCVVRRSGVVSCWGDNYVGQLGAGLAAESSESPVDVRGVTRARRVAAGGRHACALLDDGGVACWGDNQYGATSGGVAYTYAVRQLVEPDAVAVSASAVAVSQLASFAVVRGGAISVWGASPLDDVVDEHPRLLPDVAGVDALVAEGSIVCTLRQGALACFGTSSSHFGDYRGQTAKPIAIATHAPVRRVRVGARHGCALLVDGRVECWGSNTEGQLGRRDATDESKTYPPNAVEDLPSAIDVFAGNATSCALTDARDLYCWGASSVTPAPVRL